MFNKKNIFFIIAVIFLLTPFFSDAVEIGISQNFFISSEFDLKGRQEISASLQKISPKL